MFVALRDRALSHARAVHSQGRARSKGARSGTSAASSSQTVFYEFTDPEDTRQKRLDKWLFTMRGHRWFCMAGIWRESPVGETFTMLTLDAGEDVGPYHHRQIFPLPRDRWAAWLDPQAPAEDVLGVLSKGSLLPEWVYRPAPARAALL